MGNVDIQSAYILVISCPCALVISIPLSFFAGIGGASNQGVLVKVQVILKHLQRQTLLSLIRQEL